MILYSFLLGSHWILEGVTVSPYILGGHWILGLIDPGGQWFLGYSYQGSLKPTTPPFWVARKTTLNGAQVQQCILASSQCPWGVEVSLLASVSCTSCWDLVYSGWRSKPVLVLVGDRSLQSALYQSILAIQEGGVIFRCLSEWDTGKRGITEERNTGTTE